MDDYDLEGMLKGAVTVGLSEHEGLVVRWSEPRHETLIPLSGVSWSKRDGGELELPLNLSVR